MPMQQLPMYVIYKNPSDYPNRYVVRLFLITDKVLASAEPECVCDSLYQARDAIPGGLVRISRNDGDDPVIVETWF